MRSSTYLGHRVNPRKRKKRFPILVLVTLFIGLSYYFLFYSSFFSIKEVVVRGTSSDEHVDITNQYQQGFEDKNIFLLSSSKIETFIAEKTPSYKVLKILKTWPGKIEIEVKKRDRKYFVQAPNGIYIIDSENFVSEQPNAFLGFDISIKYDQGLQIGQEVTDPTLLSAFSYVNNGMVINIVNNEINIDLEGGGKVILPKNSSETNIEEMSSVLQKIIQKYTIENKEIEIIDLRFSKPVIKYK